MTKSDLSISYYEYNAFVIEHGGKTVAIDPGATFFYYFQMKTAIPKSLWPSVSHIVVTHGDPDHYWFADKMVAASRAPVVMNEAMIRDTPAGPRALGPRSKGLAFDWDIANAEAMSLGETRKIDGISFSTVKATHGPLTLKVGPFQKTEYPGSNERVGWGSMGFVMTWNGRTLVNLADTLLEKEAWASIVEPDVLMLPIGGKEAHNTMDVDEAVEAVKMIRPKVVIPMHYNLRAFFTTKYCPADEQVFRTRVERLGSRCILLSPGETWRECQEKDK